MRMNELNTEQEKNILMIHPMLSSANGFKECFVKYLGNDFRYFLPDLAGHASANEETYQSAKEEAKQIHDYLIQKNISNIDLVFGASLGGVVLFELIQYEDINFKHIVFEGTSFFENASLLNFIMTKIMLKKHRKAVKNPELAVKKMTKIYGSIAAEPMANNFINIDEESIKNIMRDCSFVELPSLSEELQEKCIFAYGSKDIDRKKAKKIQPVKYPKAKIIIWEGLGHCQKMSKNSKAYSEFLRKLFKDNL